MVEEFLIYRRRGRTKWQLFLMCLVFSWKTPLSAICIVLWLLQYNGVTIYKCPKAILAKACYSSSISKQHRLIISYCAMRCENHQERKKIQ